MRVRRSLAVLLSLALVAPLAACGGDEPLTATEYREKVNSICERRDKVLDDLEPDAQNGDSFAAALDEARPAIQDAADALEDLNVPAELKGDHEKLREGIAGQAEESERLAPLLKGKEGAEVQRVSAKESRKLASFSKQVDDAAERLRVEQC